MCVCLCVCVCVCARARVYASIKNRLKGLGMLECHIGTSLDPTCLAVFRADLSASYLKDERGCICFNRWSSVRSN
jgi:hypothetical protein